MTSNEKKLLFEILNNLYSKGVEKELILKIIDSGELIHLKDNDLLFEEGSESDSMYILINGSLKVFKKYNQALTQVGEIKKGESIGEMGLISDEVRSASIYSKRPSTLFKISKKNFDYLIRDNWHIMYDLMKQIISRFQKTLNLEVTYSTQFLSVLPISKERDNDNKGGSICRHLKDSLKNIGSTYYLSREIVNEQLGIEDINLELKKLNSSEVYSPLDNLISHLESDYNYIILQSDSENTSWTEWCLYMGDKFLLILNSIPGINNQEILKAVNFINENVPEHLSIERHLLIFHDHS